MAHQPPRRVSRRDVRARRGERKTDRASDVSPSFPERIWRSTGDPSPAGFPLPRSIHEPFVPRPAPCPGRGNRPHARRVRGRAGRHGAAARARHRSRRTLAGDGGGHVRRRAHGGALHGPARRRHAGHEHPEPRHLPDRRRAGGLHHPHGGAQHQRERGAGGAAAGQGPRRDRLRGDERQPPSRRSGGRRRHLARGPAGVPGRRVGGALSLVRERGQLHGRGVGRVHRAPRERHHALQALPVQPHEGRDGRRARLGELVRLGEPDVRHGRQHLQQHGDGVQQRTSFPSLLLCLSAALRECCFSTRRRRTGRARIPRRRRGRRAPARPAWRRTGG
jgi:hypothetical protein